MLYFSLSMDVENTEKMFPCFTESLVNHGNSIVFLPTFNEQTRWRIVNKVKNFVKFTLRNDIL